MSMEGTSFEGTYFGHDIDFLSPVECELDQYAFLSRSETCPSLSSSFLTVDTSGMSFDDYCRRSSFSSQSISPGYFTTSSGSLPSPTTPLRQQQQVYDPSKWFPNTDKDVWQQAYMETNPAWLTLEDSSISVMPLDNFDRPYSAQMIRPETAALLSRSKSVCQLGPTNLTVQEHVLRRVPSHSSSHMVVWSDQSNVELPETIEPCATFRRTVCSSPPSKFATFTPLQHRTGTTFFSSSPLSSIPSSVVPSQYESDESVSSSLGSYTTDKRRPSPHLFRRHSRHRNVLKERSSNRRTSQLGNSGVDCDVVIPQNEYPCNWPGCIDKDTGRPRRFKRQEHRKRHERTVHEKKTIYPCWVICGGRPCGKEFTRNDNLQSHLKKTHGKKSQSQRNPYVATQDPDSQYYDEKWTGPLTMDGLPVGHPLWPTIAYAPEDEARVRI